MTCRREGTEKALRAKMSERPRLHEDGVPTHRADIQQLVRGLLCTVSKLLAVVCAFCVNWNKQVDTARSCQQLSGQDGPVPGRLTRATPTGPAT